MAVKNDLQIAVIIDNPLVRQSITTALRRKYNCNVYETGSLPVALEILRNDAPDLVIMVSHIGDFSLSENIRLIRTGEVGHNRFVVVVVLIYDTAEIEIYKLLNYGPDDIVLMPISVKLIYDRVDNLIIARKPFVVTRDYIGPDRRQENRSVGAKLIVAPNPLSNKLNNVPASDVQKQIDSFNNELNEAMIVSCQNKLKWLAERISGLHLKDFDIAEVIDYSSKLVDVISELNKLTNKWDDTQIAFFTDDILNSINKLLINNGRTPVSSIEELIDQQTKSEDAECSNSLKKR